MNKQAWKIYAWFGIISTGLSLLNIANILRSNSIDILALVLGTISVLGVYGYAYDKDFGPKLVWKIFSVIFLIFLVAVPLFINQFFRDAEKNASYFLVVFIYIGVTIPTVLALYRYSFHSRD